MTQKPDAISIIIGEDAPARLDKALALYAPEDAALSRSRLAKLLDAGAVMKDGQVVSDAKAKVAAGEVFEVQLPEAVEFDVLPEDIPLDVVFEDDDLIVVNKAAGMVVHPAPGSPKGTLVNALLAHCGDSLSGIGGEKRPGIVHRIDKDTTGLLVVAKHDAAHQGLAKQFEKHTVHRRYQALCFGVPSAADPRLVGLPGIGFEPGNIMRITANLDRHKHDRQRQAVVKNSGRHAVTRAAVETEFGAQPALALMKCWLETGRTHQIRVHMAYAGHGLIGDPLYGGKRKLPKNAVSEAAFHALNSFPRQALHAAELGFIHPISGEKHQFSAVLPDDFLSLISALTP